MVTKQVGELRWSVTSIEPENTISAGVTWGSLGPDMVPLFEEHTTRLEREYTLTEWYALPMMERAMAVAMRRLDIAARNLQSDAEIRKAKQDAKKK